MKKYYLPQDKIVDLPKTIEVDGINRLTSKMTEDELIAQGYYPISYESKPNRRYYTSTENKALVGNVYTIAYTPTEKPLVDVQATLIASVEETANKKFNEATTGYTAGEMSSWNELESDAREHQVEPLLSGMLYDEAMISGITVDELADKVLTNAIGFKQVKSYLSGTRKKKILEVAELNFDACILYEATPYDYTLTEEDIVDGIGEGTIGDVVVRYRNNVTEW